MGVPFQVCDELLPTAVEALFDCEPQIQAVGIGRHEAALGFKAVKNAAQILPASLAKGARKLPKSIKKVPVTIEGVTADLEPHLLIPHPMAASLVPEQRLHRPLACGLQIQNADDDHRRRKAGKLGPNLINIGTLGCLAKLATGPRAILSNHHVLAGENRSHKLKDRILQPGSLAFSSSEYIATLTNFVALKPNPTGARPALGNVVYNQGDAAVAQLKAGIPSRLC